MLPLNEAVCRVANGVVCTVNNTEMSGRGQLIENDRLLKRRTARKML